MVVPLLCAFARATQNNRVTGICWSSALFSLELTRQGEVTVELEPEISGGNIVLLGNFNPTIFHPSWFERNGLATAEEAANATVEVVHPEITSFTMGYWSLRVQPERVTIETVTAPWIRLADLLARVFGEFLPHTPIYRAGINASYHFRIGSVELRTKWGRELAPLKLWGEWGERIERVSRETPDLTGGLQVLSVREPWRDNGFSGHWMTQIEPSVRIPGNSGVFVQVNHEVQSLEEDPARKSSSLIRYIETNFDKIVSDSEWIVDQVLSQRPTK